MMKANMVALGLMVGLGVAAPLAAWYAHEPDDSLAVARASCGVAARVANASPLAIELPEPVTIEIEKVVLYGTPQHAAARHLGEVRCSWHASVAIADAPPVRVCDIERSDNGQRGGLLTPRLLPTRLAPRDLPSPTGLLVEGRTSDRRVEIFGGPTALAH